jgi:hypothetical protein
MKDIIERLRREKAKFDEEKKQSLESHLAPQKADFSAGKEAGLEWAKDAHYEEIIKYKSKIIITGHDPDWGHLRSIMRKNKNNIHWAKGWLEGVREFWDEVENKL